MSKAQMLLQVAILGLLEDDNMHVSDVVKLCNKTAAEVWQAVRHEEE